MEKVTEMNKQPQDVYIDVECNFEIPEHINNGEELQIIDEEAFMYELLMNIALKLSYYNFDLIKNKPSDDWGSHYFEFYIQDTNGKRRDNYLIHLTVSKCCKKSTTNEEYITHLKNYMSKFGNEYKECEEPPVSIPCGMVVGARQFQSEYDILTYIKRVLQKLKEPGINVEETLQKFKNGV